ncbi:Peroxisome biogenesis protein 2 [Camellia lanceoleosa]|nr:Peroxisome biogenesis protein 2 [Camellia lanceoleosa]
MLLPTPPGCVSSTTVCVSSGGCVSSDNVNGVPITAGHASEADNTLPLVAVFRRPVFIPGTMSERVWKDLDSLWYCVATVGGQYIWSRLQSFSAFRRWGDSEQVQA